MADTTQNSYFEPNEFDKVLFQRGRDVRDCELNEFQDIFRVFLLRTIYAGLQNAPTPINPGYSDNSFKVVGTGANNAVTIDQGTMAPPGALLCDGIPIRPIIPGSSPLAYGSFTYSGFATRGANGIDTVYLAISEVEVADPSASPQLGPTTTRRQLQVTVNVSPTGPGGVPANSANEIWQGGTHYFKIANVTRRTGDPVIHSTDVTDLRLPLFPIQQETVTTEIEALQAAVPLNWKPEFQFNNGASNFVFNVAWDPHPHTALGTFGGSWLVAAYNLSGSDIIVSFTFGMDDGATGAVVNLTGLNFTNAPAYGAVAADPSTAGHYIVTYVDDTGGGNNTFIDYWNGSAWSQIFTSASFTQSYGVEMTNIGAYTVAAVADQTNGQLYSITGGAVTVTTNTPAMAANSSWCLKSNGSLVVAIPSQTSLYTVWTTPDGFTWSSNAGLATAIGGSGSTVVGLAYASDDLGPCWIACVQEGSTPKWFRSEDALTWTAQAGGVTTAMTLVDMAAIGSTLVCTSADVSSTGPSGSIFSVDGGITWYPTQTVLTTNSSSALNQKSRVISAGGKLGFMVANGLQARFSELGGLPAAQL